MATPTYVLHRIRQKLRKEGSPPPEPPTEAFDRRKEAYHEIFEAVHIFGGDIALDDLTHWIVTQVEETGELPKLERVKKQARMICAFHDVGLPEDTVLSAESETKSQLRE